MRSIVIAILFFNFLFSIKTEAREQSCLRALCAQTGSFTPITGNINTSSFPTQITPVLLSYSPDGRFLAVANAGSGTISVYQVNQFTGALTPAINNNLIASSFSTGSGSNPIVVNYSPDGRFLLATVMGSAVVPNSIIMYSVNQVTGALTPAINNSISSSSFPVGSNPADAIFSPDGRFVAVAGQSANNIRIFSVNQSTGALIFLQDIAAQSNPQVLAYSPDQQFLAVGNSSSSTITIYRVNPITGVLTYAIANNIIASSFSTGVGSVPFWVTYSPDGRFLAVDDDANNTIIIYSVNQATGAITPITGSIATSSIATQSFPFAIDYSPVENFAAVVNMGSNTITVYAVDPVTGAFSFVSGTLTASSVPTQLSPFILSYSPDGKFAAVTNAGANTITVYNTNAGAELAISKTALPSPVIAGENLTYQITVLNRGVCDAQNVTISDALPELTTFVSEQQISGPAFTCSVPAVGSSGSVVCTSPLLSAGDSATFEITVHVASTAPQNSLLSNTANVASTTPNPNPSNASSTAITPVESAISLIVEKMGTATLAGNNIIYKITVTNRGPSAATNVILRDVTPSGTTFISESQVSGPAFNCTVPEIGSVGTVTCSIPVLDSGQTAIFMLVFRVNSSVPDNTILTNTVVVTSDQLAPVTATSSTRISASADLAVTVNGSTFALAGQVVNYNIQATNNGPSDAQNVLVIYTFSPGVTILSAPGGTISGSTVTYTLGTLTTGTTINFAIQARINSDAPEVIISRVTIRSSTSDPNLFNNIATLVTNICTGRQGKLFNLLRAKYC